MNFMVPLLALRTNCVHLLVSACPIGDTKLIDNMNDILD